MRVSINIDENDLKLIDEKAKSMYMSRSAFMAYCAIQKIKSDMILSNLPNQSDLKEMFKSMEAMINKLPLIDD